MFFIFYALKSNQLGILFKTENYLDQLLSNGATPLAMKKLKTSFFLIFIIALAGCSSESSVSIEQLEAERIHNLKGYDRTWTLVDASPLLDVGCEFLNTIDEPNDDGTYTFEENLDISCEKSAEPREVIFTLLDEYNQRLELALENTESDQKRTLTMKDESAINTLRYHVILRKMNYAL